MSKQIKGIFTKADESNRLKYLLAKEDIDDIQTAVVVLKDRLRGDIPELNVSVFADKIMVENLSGSNLTIIDITLREAHLFLKYNLYGTPGLFNRRNEPDMEIIEKVKQTITALEFYKTGEKNIESEDFHYKLETYKLDVHRRKL